MHDGGAIPAIRAAAAPWGLAAVAVRKTGPPFLPRPGETPAGDEGRSRRGGELSITQFCLPQLRPNCSLPTMGLKFPHALVRVISSALYAAGITVFGHHHRDGAAQKFSVNGQCSQCMVMAGGKPVKACMTPVTQGMQVQSVEGLPALGDDTPVAAVL